MMIKNIFSVAVIQSTLTLLIGKKKMKKFKDFKGRRMLVYIFGLAFMIGLLAAFENDFVTSLAIIYAGFILFSGLLSEKSMCKTKTDLK